MTPLLQQILLSSPPAVPPNPQPTRSNRIMQDNNPHRHKTPLGETTVKIKEALIGQKWWSVTDLADYLKFDSTIVYNTLARHSKKFNVESFIDTGSGSRAKYFRIKS